MAEDAANRVRLLAGLPKGFTPIGVLLSIALMASGHSVRAWLFAFVAN
jgi:hypothetical protein